MMDIFDLHADIGYDVMQKRARGETNILDMYHVEKCKAGGIRYINMASNFEGDEDWGAMQAMILALKEEVDRCAMVDLVVDQKGLCKKNDHIKAILSVEGMCGIQEDAIAKIDWLYQQGVRIASLCWNDENALATGVKGNPKRGLTSLGKDVVTRMIKHNMAIDVSHTNEKTFWDIMKFEQAILIATHSNARALCDHPRNLYQKQMEAIKAHHGMIGVVSAPFFVHQQKDKQDVAHMVKQLQYVVDIMGVDHVGLGFDYMDFYDDCQDVHVKELKNAAYSQNIINAMKTCFDDRSIAKIASENACKFLSNILV